MHKADETLQAIMVFNPGAGAAGGGDEMLQTVQRLLQEVRIEAPVFEAAEPQEFAAAAAEARRQGVSLVIACGGDGTLEGVANELVNSSLALGILPAGTRNNLAASLQVPTELPQAAALLRSGTRQAIDAVHASCGSQERWCFELFTAGLLSDMFENAEAVQKGNWGALGSLAAKFVGSTPATLHLAFTDDEGSERSFAAEAHAILALNTPYVGANFRVAEDIRYDDGCLDVFLYAGLNQLDVAAHGLAIATDAEPDPRIRRFRARRLALRAEPPVPSLVDGVNLGEGPVTLEVHPGALQVITGHTPAAGAAPK